MIGSGVYVTFFNMATNLWFNVMANVMLTGQRLAQISGKISDPRTNWVCGWLGGFLLKLNISFG